MNFLRGMFYLCGIATMLVFVNRMDKAIEVISTYNALVMRVQACETEVQEFRGCMASIGTLATDNLLDAKSLMDFYKEAIRGSKIFRGTANQQKERTAERTYEKIRNKNREAIKKIDEKDTAQNKRGDE